MNSIVTDSRSAPRPSAWGRLLRLPALFSAPGDPLAGFLLAQTTHTVDLGAALPVALGSLCIYAGGMIQNDWADVAVDAAERPDRPLPAGEIPTGHAAVSAMALTGAGIGTAALAGPGPTLIAALLALCVLAYNFALKKQRLLGPPTLAVCRGLNVLLGAAAAGMAPIPASAVVAAISVAVYIYTVAVIARDETSGIAPGRGRHLPGVAAVAAVAAISIATGTAGLLAIPLGAALLWQHRLATRALAHMPQAVGRWLRAVILLQAFACTCGGPTGATVSAALIGAWFIAGLLGRRFYSS